MRRNRVDRETGTPATPLLLEEFLLYRLWVASETASRIFSQRYEKAFGISLSEWRVLAVLGEGRTETTRGVIHRSHMDRVRVSRAVIRLADKGLIDRRPDPDDLRAQLLRLSPRGMSMYRAIVPMGRRMEDEMTRALSGEEILTLNSLLARLQASLGVMDARADDGDTP